MIFMVGSWKFTQMQVWGRFPDFCDFGVDFLIWVFFSAKSVKHLIFVDFFWFWYRVRLWFSWLDRGNSIKCIFAIDFMILAISGWISWSWRMFAKQCQQNLNFADLVWFIWGCAYDFHVWIMGIQPNALLDAIFRLFAISGWNFGF